MEDIADERGRSGRAVLAVQTSCAHFTAPRSCTCHAMIMDVATTLTRANTSPGMYDLQ